MNVVSSSSLTFNLLALGLSLETINVSEICICNDLLHYILCMLDKHQTCRWQESGEKQIGLQVIAGKVRNAESN